MNIARWSDSKPVNCITFRYVRPTFDRQQSAAMTRIVVRPVCNSPVFPPQRGADHWHGIPIDLHWRQRRRKIFGIVAHFHRDPVRQRHWDIFTAIDRHPHENNSHGRRAQCCRSANVHPGMNDSCIEFLAAQCGQDVRRLPAPRTSICFSVQLSPLILLM